VQGLFFLYHHHHHVCVHLDIQAIIFFLENHCKNLTIVSIEGLQKDNSSQPDIICCLDGTGFTYGAARAACIFRLKMYCSYQFMVVGFVVVTHC